MAQSYMAYSYMAIMMNEKSKRTTPGIPTWSPTVVLTWPDNA